MKILSMYLPQFHRVKENDEWWGEGFTEWTTVNNAVKLFPDHEQPRRATKQYDLLDKSTMEWQEKLMKAYGVDGFCFYHYYFENGKRILEKPAENLLIWDDIDIPFCFYWANESWIRSWSNISGGNSWSEIYDKSKKEENEGVLLRQNYGGESDWKEHFEYLLPFFKDERYIRFEGHPIFIIYKPDDIECLSQMKECWNRWMQENGLASIYFIGKGSEQDALDATVLHQPQRIVNSYNNDYGIAAITDYDDAWNHILTEKITTNRKVFLGGFVGYDDTPRRGKSGYVYQGQTPEKFKSAMIRLLVKAHVNKSEFVFINAWNEWGEGMYLEPDEKWGTQYLGALRDARTYFEENKDILIACAEDNKSNEISTSDGINSQVERYRGYWKVLDRWLKLSLQGRSISDYFKKNKYKNIAIYGMGMLGENLLSDMKKNNLRAGFAIDQNPYKGRQFEFPIYTLDDEWDKEKADIIVVTVDYAFDSIKKSLEQKKSGLKIVSLKMMIEELEIKC